jgi:hypothetical protein
MVEEAAISHYWCFFFDGAFSSPSTKQATNFTRVKWPRKGKVAGIGKNKHENANDDGARFWMDGTRTMDKETCKSRGCFVDECG